MSTETKEVDTQRKRTSFASRLLNKQLVERDQKTSTFQFGKITLPSPSEKTDKKEKTPIIR